VALFSNKTRPRATSRSTPNVMIACLDEISPDGMGLSLVRSTWASILRSAKSLIAQPAERITKVPAINISTTFGSGLPLEANHSAQSVGQSSSSVPTGRSIRVSRRKGKTVFQNAVSVKLDVSINVILSDPTLDEKRNAVWIMLLKLFRNLFNFRKQADISA